MPQINEYTQQNTAQGALGTRQASGVDYGADVGKATQNVGAGMADASQQLFQIQQEEDVTKVHVKMAKAQADMEQKFKDMASQAQPGTKDFADQMQAQVQEYMANAQEGVSTRAGASLFARMSGDMNGYFQGKAINFQAQLDGEAAKGQYIDILQNYGKIAFNDPTALGMVTQQGLAAIDDPKGIFSRIDQATRDSFKRAFTNDLNEASVRGMAQHSPEYLLSRIAPDIMSSFKQTTRVSNAIGLAPGEQVVMDGPRGIRNNNPGNISKTSEAWGGEVQGKDERYKSFATPEDGIAAIGKNLMAYQNKHGINTVSGIVSRWAPANENDTASYIKQVAQSLGVQPDQPVNVSDPAVMMGLTKAIIQRENGKNPYSDDQIRSGLAAAINGGRPDTQSNGPANLNAFVKDQPPAKIGIAAFDSLPWQKQYDIVQTAEQQVRANQVRDNQAEALKAKQLAEDQDKNMQGMLEKIQKDQLTPDDVMGSNLNFQQKEHMLRSIDAQNNKLNKTDQRVWNDLWTQINLPEDDPQKLVYPTALYNYVGKGLSLSDMKQLKDFINDKGGPTYELRKSFLSQAKSRISGSNPMMGIADPEGDQQFYAFMSTFQQSLADGQKEGKSLSQMLNPQSKDYVGWTIDKYARNSQQRMNAAANIIKQNAQPAGIKAEPRKQGESPADYLKRTGQAQ